MCLIRPENAGLPTRWTIPVESELRENLQVSEKIDETLESVCHTADAYELHLYRTLSCGFLS